MKKIGLVGGTGPESTLMYYKELNSRIDEMTGNKAMPDITMIRFKAMMQMDNVKTLSSVLLNIIKVILRNSIQS